ncbi:MAG: integrase domain-containing protein [Deltaproteobacteria bacterium]|nr:MAG: integrase domain-containing protein [Deltaproteobacteria bacterium]RLC19523.1 MAG: integrase domain-containing protein [Deltaproteobacteria bacterium]
MTKLRQQMIRSMELRDLSENTQKSYLQAVTGLAKHYMLPPNQLSQEMLEDYLLYLKNDLGRAPKTCGVAKAALNFFYHDVRANEKTLKFSIKRNNRKLPVVLNPDEVWKIINAANNPKRAMPATQYPDDMSRHIC